MFFFSVLLLLQTLTSSYGWCASGDPRKKENPSPNGIITILPANFVSTKKDRRLCSIVLCTRCAIIDSVKFTPKEVSERKKSVFFFFFGDRFEIWAAADAPDPKIVIPFLKTRQFPGKPTGYDRVRNMEIGNKDFELETLEEAYTTEHWLVRIYKVKDLRNRGN